MTVTISVGYQANFDTLRKAFRNGDVCLMECTDSTTGKPVVAICAVERIEGDYAMKPLAKMFDGNPYEELNPPPLHDGPEPQLALKGILYG